MENKHKLGCLVVMVDRDYGRGVDLKVEKFMHRLDVSM